MATVTSNDSRKGRVVNLNSTPDTPTNQLAGSTFQDESISGVRVADVPKKPPCECSDPKSSPWLSKESIRSMGVSEKDITFGSEERQSNSSSSSTPEHDNQDNNLELSNAEKGENAPQQYAYDEKPFSVFTHNEKRLIMICAGICALFSPLSGQIYFPSLDVISRDLRVDYNLVNLTITTYMIMQGLAPSFVGGFSDASGRRPAYLACCVIYIAANIGLGHQNSYAALMVLRCVQSAGSSGTVALANAVVADLVTSQERGVYVAYLSVTPQAGPSLGPIIGGLLGQYLGWHAIFWFLLILAGVVTIPMIFIYPETCRKVVEDGSVPPPKWYRCYLNTRVERRLVQEGKEILYSRRDELSKQRKMRFPNPFGTIKIVFTKEAGFVLIYAAIVLSGFYSTVALIPSQFGSIYGFNEIQIALCYLPLGAGTTLAAFVRGRLIDSRFRYHAKRLGIPLERNRRMDLDNFPIERARIEVALPTLAVGSVCVIGFGWMVQAKVNLAGPLIFLFILGFCISASNNCISVLLVDIYPGKAATASAANNLCRCWLGAGATAAVVPLINKIGLGGTTTFFGGIIVLFSPILWYVMINGPKWRRAAKQRKVHEKAPKETRSLAASTANEPNPQTKEVQKRLNQASITEHV